VEKNHFCILHFFVFENGGGMCSKALLVLVIANAKRLGDAINKAVKSRFSFGRLAESQILEVDFVEHFA